MSIVLLVIFVVLMMVWLLSLVGALPNAATVSPWLAFLAVLVLGVYMFCRF